MQFDKLKRREFITLLGGAAVARPLAARAQQAAMPMLGVLNGASFNEQFYAPLVAQFRLGLKELGFSSAAPKAMLQAPLSSPPSYCRSKSGSCTSWSRK